MRCTPCPPIPVLRCRRGTGGGWVRAALLFCAGNPVVCSARSLWLTQGRGQVPSTPHLGSPILSITLSSGVTCLEGAGLVSLAAGRCSPAAPAMLGARAGQTPGSPKLQEPSAAGCAAARARMLQNPGVFLLFKRFRGFPTRDWCRASVPWLLVPRLGTAAISGWTVSRRGWQEGQCLLGREKGGNPPSEEKNLRAGDVTAGGGKGLSCSGDGGAGGGREGVWWDQRGCGLTGWQRCSQGGSGLRPGVPPAGRAAVANDAVKQQPGRLQGRRWSNL